MIAIETASRELTATTSKGETQEPYFVSNSAYTRKTKDTPQDCFHVEIIKLRFIT